MSHQTPATHRPLTTALAEAAAMAGHAPSVHNTQPWRWRVLPEALELRMVRDAQLTATDPAGELVTLSCGAALHHARLALAAEGWTATVHRLPDPDEPELLARLTDLRPTGVDPDAMRTVQCMQVRRTDRRPVSDEPVADESLAAVASAAVAEGARLEILDRDQVLQLAAAASHAATVEAEDPQLREELAYWTSRAGGTGLTPEVLPEQAPETTVPGRDFGRPGSLPVGPGHDRAASYGVLHGDEDTPLSWLRAGEALSAAWLVATRLGVSMVPLSGVVEVGGTRQILRQVLAGLGQPYLVLRLGVADPAHAGPPHTPRLPRDQVVDTSAVDGHA
ncbi:Acg family FMN-binding oxidoreductase [Micromonospora endophytica]|uniref:Nitroreductase n=1 Tax=Micromonospora endophytica TaxID=515350 RepID=A0A2W2CFV3_9ACTN|nr:nitroreductase [Micromonospora endophytica]PZF84536.1 nitroreductase [Micromonospora endophytica]RIW39891.1 nitroreductase [Micromonospora endophytica]BCJ57650.1 NAD(P)H nitroreductase [Micromonospora endophytica]